jgi:hypothetical protein
MGNTTTQFHRDESTEGRFLYALLSLMTRILSAC